MFRFSDVASFDSPKEESVWKLHLVQPPDKDQKTGKLLFRLIGSAQRNIEDSRERRAEKARSLLMPLAAKISHEVETSQVMATQLLHKRNIALNNIHIDELYASMSKDGFEKAKNPVRFLKEISVSASRGFSFLVRKSWKLISESLFSSRAYMLISRFSEAKSFF